MIPYFTSSSPQLSNNQKEIKSVGSQRHHRANRRTEFNLPLSSISKSFSNPLLSESQFLDKELSTPIVVLQKPSDNPTISTVDEFANEKLQTKSEKTIQHHKSSAGHHKSHSRKNEQLPWKTKNGYFLLSKESINKNNEFFVKSGGKSIDLTNLFANEGLHKKANSQNLDILDFPIAKNEKEFDTTALNLLAKSLDHTPTTNIFSLKNRIFEFCRSSLLCHFNFYKNADPYEEYLDYEADRISLLFSIIQRSILLIDILPRFIALRNHLGSYLRLDQERTVLTTQLYIHLQNLTKFSTFSSADCEIIHGKDVSEFLNEIGIIFSQIEFNHEYDSKKVIDLLIQALGGLEEGNKGKINYEAGSKILNFLKDWSRPGNGGLSEEYQLLMKYCSKMAPLCMKVTKLSEIEFHCHIDHLYTDSESATQTSKTEVRILHPLKTEEPSRSRSPRSEQKSSPKHREKLSPSRQSEEKLTSTSRMDDRSNSHSPRSFEENSYPPRTEGSQSSSPSPRLSEKHVHFTRSDQIKTSFTDIFPLRRPKSKSTSEKSKAVFSKLSSSDPTIKTFSWFEAEQNAPQVFSPKGLRLNVSSYSRKPVEAAIRSLIPNEEIIPNRIIVNNKIFYANENSQVVTNSLPLDLREKYKWVDQSNDPTFNFWFNLFQCFYSEGLGNITSEQLMIEAEMMQAFNEKCPKDFELKIPCLKVAELMTIECRAVAQKYITFLFPKLFSSFYDEKKSPYIVTYPQGSEFEVQIASKDKFSVTQINTLNICLADNLKEVVATITYTWNNKPTLDGEEKKGWDGVLKLVFKVLNLDHWKPIMNIATNPSDLSDLSSRTDLPAGLHFSKVIRHARRKS